MIMESQLWLSSKMSQVAATARSTSQTVFSLLSNIGVPIKASWIPVTDAAIAHTRELQLCWPKTQSDSSAQFKMFQLRIMLEFQLIWVSIFILDKDPHRVDKLKVNKMKKTWRDSSITLVQTDLRSSSQKSVMKASEISLRKLRSHKFVISRPNWLKA